MRIQGYNKKIVFKVSNQINFCYYLILLEQRVLFNVRFPEVYKIQIKTVLRSLKT